MSSSGPSPVQASDLHRTDACPEDWRSGFTNLTASAVAGNDIVQSLHALFASFAAVIAHARQVGADAVITYDTNDTLTLHGVAIAFLVAADFQFA